MGHLHEELKRVFALDDEMKRDFEEWQAKHASPVRKRAYGEGLVFKTTYTEPQPIQQQSAMVMDDQNFVEFFEKNLTPVLGKVIAGERKRMREHVSKELGQLRADIEILRSIVAGKTTEIERKKDVA
jgi:hypothetical protein